MLYMIMKSENGGDFLPAIIVGLLWGIGLAIHYVKVFGTQHLDFLGINPNWEEEELEKELSNLTHERELRERIEKENDILDDLDGLELKKIEKRRLDQ